MSRYIQKSFQDHNRPDESQTARLKRTPLILILENIRSGNNVGSLLRTADAFLVERVYLTGYTPTPPHREILKTSLGAERTVPWEQVPGVHDAIHEVRSRNYLLAALEQTNDSVPLHRYSGTDSPGIAVVLGNEVRGVSQEALDQVDQVLEIKQLGAKQSLNVSVATGILCYQLWQLLDGKN